MIRVFLLTVFFSLTAAAFDSWDCITTNKNCPGDNSGSGSGSDYPGQRRPGPISSDPLPRTCNETYTNAASSLRIACGLAPEYDCPLFNNRPYDSLIQALDIMSATIDTTPECAPMKETMSGVHDNTQRIREALVVLQQYMSQPDSLKDPVSGQLPVGQLDEHIRIAIESATRLGTVFSSNPLLRSECGRELMGTGKVLLALNDIANNLAPYALMAFAVNPAVGMTAKFALTGGAAATSALSTFVKMVDQNTVDMNVPEHRMAILQNTCQFWKIDRKISYMRLASTQQIDEITRDLQKEESLFEERVGEPSPALQATIASRQKMDIDTLEIERLVSRHHQGLMIYEAQLRDSRNNPLLACVTGHELLGIFQSGLSGFNSTPAFPAAMLNVLDAAAQLRPGVAPDTRVSTLGAFEAIARRKLAATLRRALDESVHDEEAVNRCADQSRAWVGSLRQTLTLSLTLTNEARDFFEQRHAEDAEYVFWRDNNENLRQSQITHQRIVRALRTLAADDSVIQRSELEQRHHVLKSALFGKRGFSLGRAPVHEWLEHTLRIFGNRLSSFRGNLRTLQVSSRELVPAAPEASPLAHMTLENLPLESRAHVTACRVLKNAWFDWSAAIDHLGAGEFMCDMIDELLSNTISPEIVRICVGDESFATKPTSSARLAALKRSLLDARLSPPFSSKDWAVLISRKMRELQCPKAPFSIMNERSSP
ncbi:MAG: hypothetical protein KF802_11200 [Bdellovibrionaceae bacterium]|nr:hypothetical protein [Pseudobdellovibrionaceae bacterium]